MLKALQYSRQYFTLIKARTQVPYLLARTGTSGRGHWSLEENIESSILKLRVSGYMNIYNKEGKLCNKVNWIIDNMTRNLKERSKQ